MTLKNKKINPNNNLQQETKEYVFSVTVYSKDILSWLYTSTRKK